MTAYADRGITASQLDFERPFVYLELFAGQATFSCRVYSIGFKYVVICRGMSRSGETSKIVPRIPTSCGSLGRSNNLTRHHSSVTSARSASKEFKVSKLRVGHTSPMCTAHSLVNTKGDRRNVPYDQALAAASIKFYNTSATMLSPSSSPLPLQCIRVIYGLASHAASRHSTLRTRRVTKRSLARLWRCSEEADGILLPIRCDNVLYPAVKAKNRVRFVSTFKYPSISGTRIVKRVIDYRLTDGRESNFFWPRALLF
jgi:hypothetical protein